VLQSEVVKDAELTSKLGNIGTPGPASSFGTVHAASLHVELEAALDLIDHAAVTRQGRNERPIWFYIAAVGASDVGFIDGNRVREVFGNDTRYGEALKAYSEAVASLGNSPRQPQWQGGA
jgi:hypothetical protein